MTDEAFDLSRTYVDLRDGGGAAPLPVTETFWPDLMSGRLPLEGRLVAAFDVTADAPHWECHPQGEELILLCSGAVDFILETPGGESRRALRPGQDCLLVPRGVWHRYEVREPSRLVFVTAGEGTEHRLLETG